MGNVTKRYERKDKYAETFSLKATDNLVKKVKVEITQLKKENASLKRAQGSGGQNWPGAQGGSGGGGYNGNGGRGNKRGGGERGRGGSNNNGGGDDEKFLVRMG